MATWQHELVDPPADPRARELWLQHAAGFILCEDVRKFAWEKIDPTFPPDVQAAVRKGIDDALYGLMMVIDGVTGALENPERSVHLDFSVRLVEDESDHTGLTIDLRDGDGMCMGYHGWIAGDFGEHAVAVPRPEDDE